MSKSFAQYHHDNPQVYALIIKYAREIRAAGHQHYSIRAILHRIRWHVDVVTKDPDGFKISNCYSRDYAIKLMLEYPIEFAGFFRLRTKK